MIEKYDEFDDVKIKRVYSDDGFLLYTVNYYNDGSFSFKRNTVLSEYNQLKLFGGIYGI